MLSWLPLCRTSFLSHSQTPLRKNLMTQTTLMSTCRTNYQITQVAAFRRQSRCSTSVSLGGRSNFRSRQPWLWSLGGSRWNAPCLASIYSFEINIIACSWVESLLSSLGEDSSVLYPAYEVPCSIASHCDAHSYTWQQINLWVLVQNQRICWWTCWRQSSCSSRVVCWCASRRTTVRLRVNNLSNRE